MPPRKKITLPDHVRSAVLADVALTHQTAVTADENDKVRIYLATEQGLDTYEIAEKLGDVSQPTVARWVQKGKAIYEARQQGKRTREPGSQPVDQDPVRSGEPVALG